MRILLAATLAAASGCASTGGGDLEAVTRFVERAELCQHFAGEEPYDAARRAEIEGNLRDLRCDSVLRDGQALKVSRQARPEDLRRIDEALAAF